MARIDASFLDYKKIKELPKNCLSPQQAVGFYGDFFASRLAILNSKLGAPPQQAAGY